MIKFIAAIDSKLGLANDHGIPWQGKVPTDVANFRQKTLQGTVMMGYGWYVEQKQPLPDRRNVVASSKAETMRPGFEQTTDARKFLQDAKDDVWVGGGAGLFASTLDLADELHLTLLEGDFDCTKFFPQYQDKFELVDKSDPITENGITYHLTVWHRS